VRRLGDRADKQSSGGTGAAAERLDTVLFDLDRTLPDNASLHEAAWTSEFTCDRP